MIYIPEKFEYMPKKKIVLARASTRYEKLDEELIKKINDLYLEGLFLSSPTIWYKTFNIEKLPKSIIPGKFKGVKKMTLFVSTLGEEIDKKIEHYTENGEVFSGMILDAWGSEALETLNDNFDKKLRQKYKDGTMRFSPGYEDVDIRENRTIINLLKVTKIKVLESGIMIPRKTTTCMIGWW